MTDLSFVRITVTNKPIREIGRALGGLKKIELRNLDSACPHQRLTADFSVVSVTNLLLIMSDACDRHLHTNGKGAYSYETFPMTKLE